MGFTGYHVILADTDEGLDVHYRLRHQIFREEMGCWFLSGPTDSHETDIHDRHAIHFLVQDRRTDQFVAASRLVIGEVSELPMNEYCRLDLSKSDIEPSELAVEFSRFLVLPAHRSSLMDHMSSNREGILSLLLSATWAFCREQGLTSCLFLGRRPLARAVKNLGFSVACLNDSTNPTSIRLPFHVRVNENCTGKGLPHELSLRQRRFNEEVKPYSELRTTTLNRLVA